MTGAETRALLRTHVARYPKGEVQDWVKLLYQSEFGGGHMIADSGAALAFLQQEIAQTPQQPHCLLEEIGGGLCRLHLQAFAQSALRAETVAGLFCYTAAHSHGTQAGLAAKLDILQAAADAGELPQDGAAVAAFLREYRAKGCPAVHHSRQFAAVYAPAYRLVPAQCKRLLGLLVKMDAVLRTRGSCRVGIDGNSGSGKSTLGAFLQEVYGGVLFHMDDYFLPAARKTPQRLAQSGGNVDYERFAEEILQHLPGQTFTYTPFDCSRGALGASVQVPAEKLWIIEGSYALHAQLRAAYDVKVLLRIDPQEQSRRILQREGPQMHRRFLEEWIPLEDAYFATEQLHTLCDIVL